MAKREIVVDLSGETSTFKFARVDRTKLYGRRERVVLDEQGRPCTTAYLTADGAALVPPGGSAHVYVDEDFDTIERSALRAVTEDGEPLEPVPSTLGVPQPLIPVRPERLLDCRTQSVYQLEVEALGEGLRAALADGELFETSYRYRDGYGYDPLFLLQNDEGIFALVGQETGFSWVERRAPESEEAEDEGPDELDEDLDFSMF